MSLPASLPDAALICQAPLYPGNTMTSLRLCCLTGILTMQRQGWGTGTHSPDMLLQQLFSFLCSQFILCNPFFPHLSPRLPLPLSFLCQMQALYLFSPTPIPHSFFSPSLSVSSLPSLRKSYQAACQIIRWDICLKTHLQKGIILSHRHNFNQT